MMAASPIGPGPDDGDDVARLTRPLSTPTS